MFLRTARAVRALSLGVWLGGIVMFFITASAVFTYFVNDVQTDRTTAGEVVSLVLRKAAPIKIGIALLAFLAEAAVFFSHSPEAPKGWRKFVPNALLMLAFATLLIAVFWLEPSLEALRAKIGSFSEKTKDSPLRQQFRSLHGMSMGLGVLEALLVAAALVAGLL